MTHALADTSSSIGLCCYDRRNGSVRPLTSEEISFLREITDHTTTSAFYKQPVYHRYMRSRQLVDRNVIGKSREFERSAALLLSGGDNRSGLAYELAKFALRATRTPFSNISTLEAGPNLLADRNARILLSPLTLPLLSATRPSLQPLSARLSTIMYDTVPFDFPQYTTNNVIKKFDSLFQAATTNCDTLFCISRHTADRVMYWCDKISTATPTLLTIPTSSHLEFEVKLSTPVTSLSGKSYVLYCSTIEPRKNHLLALRAWDQLIARDITPPTLVLCGRRGWNYTEIYTYLGARPDLRKHVLMLEGIADSQLAWLYKNARFTIFPSFEEGWGLGASESLDFGTPVIISTAPALSEATQGLMPAIDPNDLNAWVSSIEALISSDEHIQNLRNIVTLRYRRVQSNDTYNALTAALVN